MTNGEGGNQPAYDWARDAEPLYTFLGLYLTGFQWLEGKLDLILLLEGGHDSWAKTQARLAKMRNEQKVEAVENAVLGGDKFTRATDRPEWRSFFRDVVARLSAERRRRNSIMHSQYLLDGVEDGLSAIRSNRRRANGKAAFEQQEMTRECMDAILRELAQLAFDIGRVYTQLVAIR